MRFTAMDLPGVYILEPKVFRDQRGFFLESYSREAFARQGLDYSFVQDNHARSEQAGVLRGFHFQAPPYSQTKLVRVVRGRILDVVVDLRKGSPVFGRWLKVELSRDNVLQILVPKGFGHAYLTLEPGTEVEYKVDQVYAPESEGGLAWDDPGLGVPWPVKDPILSERDRSWPGWSDFQSPFSY